MKTSERNGSMVSAALVEDEDGIMLISDKGTMIRTTVSQVPTLSRNTQGVKIITPKDGEKLMTARQSDSLTVRQSDSLIRLTVRQSDSPTAVRQRLTASDSVLYHSGPGQYSLGLTVRQGPRDVRICSAIIWGIWDAMICEC